MPRWIAVDAVDFCTGSSKKMRGKHAPCTVPAVNNYSDSLFNMNTIKNGIFMRGKCIYRPLTTLVLPVSPVPGLEKYLHLSLLALGKRRTIRVEKFQSVIFLRVMGCGDHTPGFYRTGTICNRRSRGNPGIICCSTTSEDSGGYQVYKKGTCCPGIHADNNIAGTECQCRPHAQGRVDKSLIKLPSYSRRPEKHDDLLDRNQKEFTFFALIVFMSSVFLEPGSAMSSAGTKRAPELDPVDPCNTSG